MFQMKPRVTYSEAVAERILEGLVDGLGLRVICRQPGMPTRANVMRWLKRHPDFAASVEGARAWRDFERTEGRHPRGYTEEVAEIIFLRLCQGEGLRSVCRDPALPSRSTMHAWMRALPELRDELDFAREAACFEQAAEQWRDWGFGGKA